MNEKLYFLSCMRYLEETGKLNYKLTNKHYSSNDIYLGAKNGLDNAEMVFLFFDKNKPNTTNSIAILDNPLKLNPNKILADLIATGEAEPGYDNVFLYLDGEIYINYDENERITKEFIKSTKKKIENVKKEAVLV